MQMMWVDGALLFFGHFLTILCTHKPMLGDHISFYRTCGQVFVAFTKVLYI